MFIPLHDSNKLGHVELQYVTLALIALNAVIFFITASPQVTDVQTANSIYFSFGFVPAVINDVANLPAELVVLPQSASYLTYAFLHADFMHIAGNMLFLWVFGDNVEDAMGHTRFLIFYLICAAAGAFAHSLAVPTSQAPLIGASGATAGIIGAYLFLHPRVKVWILALGRIPLRLSAMWVLGGWIAFQVFSILTFDDSQVSWAAHIGGVIAGCALIGLFKRADVPLFDRNLAPVDLEAIKAEPPQARQVKKPKLSRKWGRPDED